MSALGPVTQQVQLLPTALLIGLAFLISFLTPRLVGLHAPKPDLDELPSGVRPRRQWLISGMAVTLAFCLPVLLLGLDWKSALNILQDFPRPARWLIPGYLYRRVHSEWRMWSPRYRGPIDEGHHAALPCHC